MVLCVFMYDGIVYGYRFYMRLYHCICFPFSSCMQKTTMKRDNTENNRQIHVYYNLISIPPLLGLS